MASQIPLRALTRTVCRNSRNHQLRQAILSTRGAATYTSPHQASKISILPTTVDTNSASYRENASSMGELTSRLNDLHGRAAQGGPEKARKKHLDQGKMLVRDRIAALVDPGTSLMELSALAGYDMYPDDVPAGGIVTGIGTVEGVNCMIVANDSTYVSRIRDRGPC